MVPDSLWCGSGVFDLLVILASSRAARNSFSLSIPREDPLVTWNMNYGDLSVQLTNSFACQVPEKNEISNKMFGHEAETIWDSLNDFLNL